MCPRSDRVYAYRTLQVQYTFSMFSNMYIQKHKEKLFDSRTKAKQLAFSGAQKKKTAKSGLFLLCPGRESNLHLSLRTGLFYPLNYRGWINAQTKNTPKGVFSIHTFSLRCESEELCNLWFIETNDH